METISASSGMPPNTVETAPEGAVAPLRLTGRPDHLTAQKVEVGIILQAMLGTPTAFEYLESNAVAPAVIERILHHPEQRRGRHDAFGIRV